MVFTVTFMVPMHKYVQSIEGCIPCSGDDSSVNVEDEVVASNLLCQIPYSLNYQLLSVKICPVEGLYKLTKQLENARVHMSQLEYGTKLIEMRVSEIE